MIENENNKNMHSMDDEGHTHTYNTGVILYIIIHLLEKKRQMTKLLRKIRMDTTGCITKPYKLTLLKEKEKISTSNV